MNNLPVDVERTQARTIIKLLRVKYAQANNDLDRKKIVFIANGVLAVLNDIPFKA